MRRISVLETIADVGASQWRHLVSQSKAPIFYDYEFLSSCETHPLQDGARALYIVVTSGSRRNLEAALPLYLHELADPFGVFGSRAIGSRFALLTHIAHCYDTRLLATTRSDAVLAGAIWEKFRDIASDLKVELFGFQNVEVGSLLSQALFDLGVASSPGVPRYQLDLSNIESLDTHLAKVGRASRRTLGKYVRRALRDGARMEVCDGRSSNIEDVLELCAETATKHAPGYYPPEALARLIYALNDKCRLLRVVLNGATLAASICFVDESTFHTWAGGARYPRDLSWSPQYVLFEAELREAWASKRPRVECGRRNDIFKLRYGLSAVPMTNHVVTSSI